MAERPIFVPEPIGPTPVKTRTVSFQWHAGMSLLQKQKSIVSLHEAAKSQLPGVKKILEISSKSHEMLGKQLSAFNLTWNSPVTGFPISVECAFQGSKVFSEGGPYVDLYEADPRDAKRDERLRSSGSLTSFRFAGADWPIEPQTVFYDWIYLAALRENPDLANATLCYDAFTDIEFNPKKSINCQAYSVALFCSLHEQGKLDDALGSAAKFLNYCQSLTVNNSRQDDTRQGRLL